ncbi:glycoside hydrolase family 99-like domain-containing protein [Paenibacillus sp. HN-1]|uniref:glycosyltransferase WbsX family protein n=1 Tax=Paenibacillus TaxID=44249 RepID=UPI001CA81ED7|nr:MULTISPECIES: glycoside hydrolase family 99-like domain-containing protein [Paenibacillus]MBY9081754.1 glycoside hydrolase family 99-like domain-containing protein [Paenibacillus sp. CGMCC 1.18879]MBY9083623.1 glycoside hydrolase family 99-like domain-containing protein [Paenibacillus sinensis]
MKLIAFLLPQFHQIQENNLWWGEGFTEWTNVKKAKPLYPGHMQPRRPFNDYYYDLTDSSAREWQAETARKYGIYGFCYYHYWFKGKRLLERPLQEVLESGEPDFPFCLSWANEPWTRKWDGMSSDVLMPQEYGDEDDWKQHFDVLLNSFRDRRYIRRDGKPLFVIYRPDSIPRCEAMLEFWQSLARDHGLPGLHFVRTLGGFPLSIQKGFEASLEFEPHYSFGHGQLRWLWSCMETGEASHLTVDYDQIWQSILSRTPHRDGEPVYPGAFVNWDNTPRMGAGGQSTLGASPRKFEHYLSEQISRAQSVYDSEFLFINSWNEWAEGAYLEPDSHHGYGYLEAVRRALVRNSCDR